MSSTQNLQLAGYLARRLEKMCWVQGFISIEILDLLKGFTELIDEPAV